MPSSNIEELFPHQKPFPFGPLLHGPSGPSGPRTWCDLRASAMLPRHPAASAWCKQWTCGPKTSEKTKFLVSSSITNISVVYHTYTYYIYILNIISIYIYYIHVYICILLTVRYCAWTSSDAMEKAELQTREARRWVARSAGSRTRGGTRTPADDDTWSIGYVNVYISYICILYIYNKYICIYYKWYMYTLYIYICIFYKYIYIYLYKIQIYIYKYIMNIYVYITYIYVLHTYI